MSDAEVRCGDCRDELALMSAASVDLIVADPPYAFDKMGSNWRASDERRVTKGQTVSNLSSGMVFKQGQARTAEADFLPYAQAMYRVLRGGAFALVFAAPRLAHGFARALEDAGFAVRDCLIWQHNEGHFKAASLRHFGAETDRRVPQPRPMFETIILAQKNGGKLVDSWRRSQLGLMAPRTISGAVPSSVFLYPKPSAVERMAGGNHPTQKPVALLEDLIHLFSCEGQTVLDPFAGSGSTAKAARKQRRRSISIEADPTYAATLTRDTP